MYPFEYPFQITVTKENITTHEPVSAEDSVREWCRNCREVSGPAFIELEKWDGCAKTWRVVQETFKLTSGELV